MADQVEEIKQKADIVSVIGERVELKKAGRHFKALCPFHSEKTPSFMVSPELQIFKCFGCGEGGDVIRFLEKFEGMDFPEVLAYLAERVGVKLERGAFEKSDKEVIYRINQDAIKFYHYFLLRHPFGRKALSYLLEHRKIKEETIKAFLLGYSPESNSAFQKYFLGKKGYKPQELERAGLAYLRSGAPLDRFAGRITFPLFDHRGNPIGFSGRLLPPEREGAGKYVNTPETILYHKSEVLYALNLTKGEIKTKDKAVVVEGEFDTITPWQAGIKNIVAIKGSALTEGQIKLISRFTKNVILALDSDFAGNQAARRGIEIAHKEGLKVKVAVLKGYKDPDEMALKDPKGLEKVIKEAVGVYDFIIESVTRDRDITTYEGISDVSRELAPVLAGIQDEIVKAHYVNLLAKKLNLPYDSVYLQVEKRSAVTPNVTLTTSGKSSEQEGRSLLEERLFAIYLLRFPSKLKEISGFISKPLYKKIFDILVKLQGKDLNIEKISKTLPPELFEGYSELILKYAEEIDRYDEEGLEKELEFIKRKIELVDTLALQKKYAQEIERLEKENNKLGLRKMKVLFNEIVKRRKKLQELLEGRCKQ